MIDLTPDQIAEMRERLAWYRRTSRDATATENRYLHLLDNAARLLDALSHRESQLHQIADENGVWSERAIRAERERDDYAGALRRITRETAGVSYVIARDALARHEDTPDV